MVTIDIYHHDLSTMDAREMGETCFTNGWWAHDWNNLTIILMTFILIILSDRRFMHVSAMVACVNLWYDWIIVSPSNTTNIFTWFEVRAHKPCVKYVPDNLLLFFPEWHDNGHRRRGWTWAWGDLEGRRWRNGIQHLPVIWVLQCLGHRDLGHVPV